MPELWHRRRGLGSPGGANPYRPGGPSLRARREANETLVAYFFGVRSWEWALLSVNQGLRHIADADALKPLIGMKG